jgi:hypothetical protein
MGVSGQLHAPAALPPGKETTVQFDRRMGGHCSRSGSDGEEERIPAPVGNRTPAV